MFTILKWFLGGIAGFVLLLAGVLMAIEWRPEPLIDTPVVGQRTESKVPPAELTLLTWNIGYAGLGKNADFFMDGGSQVRPKSKDQVEQNLNAIIKFLALTPTDLVLLQEVDSDASRTFRIDQVKKIQNTFPNHFFSRSINFKSPWVPYPLFHPIGKVESGLLFMGDYPPTKAVRHQLPGLYPWPVRVFHLKRCIHEIHFLAADQKDWVILHLHLSAFDKGGRQRKQQMVYLKELMLDLHKQGHHIIVAGDWNQAFPDVADQQFTYQAKVPKWYQRVPKDWTPSAWKWAFDPRTPSLRATNQPYRPGKNFVTIIDGFLLSPELQIREVKTYDLEFTNSDHHPVEIHVSL